LIFYRRLPEHQQLRWLSLSDENDRVLSESASERSRSSSRETECKNAALRRPLAIGTSSFTCKESRFWLPQRRTKAPIRRLVDNFSSLFAEGIPGGDEYSRARLEMAQQSVSALAPLANPNNNLTTVAADQVVRI